MTAAEEKKALRQAVRSLMRQLPELTNQEEKFILDVQMHRVAQEHPWLQEADLVLIYCSQRDEPDTRGIIGWLLYTGRRVALPVCEKDGIMEFYAIRSMEELRPGAYGILEPGIRRKIKITQKTLCIVPGLAFTRDGKRLGKGGGYYDRYLAAHPGLRTMGLTYRCLLQERIPCEAHDRPVDVVITE